MNPRYRKKSRLELRSFPELLHELSMVQAIDLLQLFPGLIAIGQQQLQSYCNEWLKRPIAREYALAQIVVDEKLLLHIHVASFGAAMSGDQAFIPIDELLGYIIDRHFPDADKRRQLHTSVRETRRRWTELGRDYEVTLGRVGTLYLTCKNPACRAELETQHRANEGQEIICPLTDVTCPICGTTGTYDSRDLHLGSVD